ncbi:hypothetical protein ES705_03546 [subsurface metagenome]
MVFFSSGSGSGGWDGAVMDSFNDVKLSFDTPVVVEGCSGFLAWKICLTLDQSPVSVSVSLCQNFCHRLPLSLGTSPGLNIDMSILPSGPNLPSKDSIPNLSFNSSSTF